MKKITLLFLIFILSGCSVQYELNIDKNINLLENVIISAENEEEVVAIQNYHGTLPIDIDVDDSSVDEEELEGIEYYDIEKGKNNNTIKFNYDYDLNKFESNVFTNSCYEYVTTIKKDNELILSTSKDFICFDKYKQLDDVTITIISKYKLIDSNADSIENRKYKWYINRDNANNKRLYLSLDTSKEDLTFFEKLIRGDYLNPFTLSILILLVGFIGYKIFKKYSEKRNEI